jgi:hypothetical protein
MLKSVRDINTKNQKEFKSYLMKELKSVKMTESSRGAFHIRFGLHENGINTYLRPQGLEVLEYPGPSISGKFQTYVIMATRDLHRTVPYGTMIPWVNNFIGASKRGAFLFNNKDLSPDGLGFAGQTHSEASILRSLKEVLYKKYDPEIADQLMSLAHSAATGKDNPSVDVKFSSQDLAKVSADYGELLSSLWAMKKLNFKESFFPTASNEPLIDFYAIRFGVKYPVSVKSGGGGKVTIQNIINAIENRSKKANPIDLSKEPSLQIFKIVNEMSMKEQMIELHKYRNTDAIKKLSEIMGIAVKDINLSTITEFVEPKSNDLLIELLDPFWKTLKMNLTEGVKKGYDKLRLIISPLGESIWKILNDDKDIKESLIRIARQVTLIQVNVDVRKTGITFQSNYFKDAEFEFGWAGYAAGNKLGFKMKVKK